MSSALRVYLRLFCLALVVLLTGCPPEDDEEDSPKAELDGVVRWWSFHQFDSGATGERQVGDERVRVGGGEVTETVDFGPMFLFPPESGPNALAEVFSNDSGVTYWVAAQAPSRQAPFPDAIGSAAELGQYQYFRKTEAKAKLRIVVTRAFIDAIDSNPNLPTAQECPWRTGPMYTDCARVMSAWVRFHVAAVNLRDERKFFGTGGTAELFGWNSTFDFDVYSDSRGEAPMWNRGDFELEELSEVGQRVQLSLSSPITIEIPLASVEVGDLFYLAVDAKAATYNRRQRESYLSAFFRDPQEADGVEWEFEGLEPVETPNEPPMEVAPEPSPPCDGAPDPEAGVLEFASDTSAAAELSGEGAPIIVTRAGGSRGRVTAKLSTSDGTGLANADYFPVTTQVVFADGEEGSRAVYVDFPLNAEAEPDKTVNLTLSEPGGCAVLGERTTAVLTILDDDRPIPLPDTYTVGGTVSGLVGSGLVLREVKSGFDITPTNGPFVFAYNHPDGSDYEVRVVSQPTDPIQVCTLQDAMGTINGANVTNVNVTCVTPAAEGPLDPAFGDLGRVTGGASGGARAIALQSDGKIVVLGEHVLARYDVDGSPDTSFGTDGEVAIEFNGGILDEANGLAIQPDGRIVVVGVTRNGAQDDFAVARYESDGGPDLDFGDDGLVMTDFSGRVDRAYAALIQPDGRIVVAGHAAVAVVSGVANDFAAARYTSEGDPDPTFGGGDGKVTTNIGGGTDLAYSAALQSDGKIIVAGRVAQGGGDDPDVGLVRYDANGVPDDDFGEGGIVRVDLSDGSWDEPSEVVLQPDGKILVATQIFVETSFQFAVARFETDGDLDSSFGDAGLATTPITDQNDFTRAVALQADGAIVVVGQTSNAMSPNFGVARYDAEGDLDTSFADDGVFTLDFFGASDGAEAVAIQEDGKIVVAGFARSGASTVLGLVRLLP